MACPLTKAKIKEDEGRRNRRKLGNGEENLVDNTGSVFTFSLFHYVLLKQSLQRLIPHQMTKESILTFRFDFYSRRKNVQHVDHHGYAMVT